LSENRLYCVEIFLVFLRVIAQDVSADR